MIIIVMVINNNYKPRTACHTFECFHRRLKTYPSSANHKIKQHYILRITLINCCRIYRLVSTYHLQRRPRHKKLESSTNGRLTNPKVLNPIRTKNILLSVKLMNNNLLSSRCVCTDIPIMFSINVNGAGLLACGFNPQLATTIDFLPAFMFCFM